MIDPRLHAIVSEHCPRGAVLLRAEELCRLWAGYGHVYRLHLEDSEGNSTRRVLKLISPPPPERTSSEGHIRKLLSYRVEVNFYREFASRIRSDHCHIPVSAIRSLQNTSDADDGDDGTTLVVVLEDLTIDYPILTERRGILDDEQVQLSLRWLARFHAAEWDIERRVDASTWCPPPLAATRPPWRGEGLWQHGGYSYLATRMEELRAVEARWANLGLRPDGPLAYAVDWALNNPEDRRRLGLIHGDVKAANMAFGHGKMAMYDFQYVGIGLGVQDLAKFLTTSIPEHGLDDEIALLRTYHAHLMQALATSSPDAAYDFESLVLDWELALVSWVRFLGGWSGGFWGSVRWLTGKVEGLLRDREWTERVIRRWQENGGQIPHAT